MAAKNRLHDAFLTANDIVVTPKFELTMRYNSGSSSRRPNHVAHRHDQRYLLGNAENTPLMTASRRLDLNIDQGTNNETRKVESF